MTLLQAAAIGLIALILSPGWLFYFDVTPKVAVLLAATGIVLPFAARGARPRQAVSVIALLYVLSLILSSWHSPDAALSWFGTNWRRYGAVIQIAVLLFAWTVAAIGNRRRILRAVTVATVLAAVYGIAQFAGFDPWLPASAYHVGEGVWTIVRPPSTFGHASYFATWLVMAAFLSVALAGMEEGRAWRWVAWIASGLAASAMLLTGTRASILGLAVGGAVWLYRRGFRAWRRVRVVTAAIALGAAAFYFSPAGWQLRSRARWFAEDPWGGARPLLWRDSLAMGLSHPLLGFGPEVFTAEFPRYESENLARAYPDFAHESPHNIFLDALVSQGLPGLLLLGLLLAQGFRTRDPAIAAALAAGVAAQQFTVFTLPTALLTFTTVALAIPVPDAPPSSAVWRRPMLALAPVALFLLFCAVRYTLADAALAEAQNRLRAGDIRGADGSYTQYARWRLPGTSADLWYSRALSEFAGRTTDPALRLQALVRSGTAALQATESSEDPFNAWYNMAQLAAGRIDAQGAERALRAAIAANPNWFKPHWTLARLLQLQGRHKEALAEAGLALRLDAGKHAEVERTLAELEPLQR
jgi:O-antigen ligase